MTNASLLEARPKAAAIPQMGVYEFNWDIINRCNYRCPYCFMDGHWERIARKDKFFPAAKWIDGWDRIYKTSGAARIIITGGEPTYCPDFIEIVEGLTRNFFMAFNTNLSRTQAWVESFARRVDPRRTFLGISFHPQFASAEEFTPKVVALKEAGFDFHVIFVCYPPILPEFPALYKRFTGLGLRVMPYPFRGTYGGKLYPEAYTPEEAAIVESMSEKLEQVHKDEVETQMNLPEPFGRMCYAGYRYFRVESDGIVYRCGQYVANSETPMGNFFDPAFRFDDGPSPCRSHRCGCEWRFLEGFYQKRLAG